MKAEQLGTANTRDCSEESPTRAEMGVWAEEKDVCFPKTGERRAYLCAEGNGPIKKAKMRI